MLLYIFSTLRHPSDPTTTPIHTLPPLLQTTAQYNPNLFNSKETFSSALLSYKHRLDFALPRYHSSSIDICPSFRVSRIFAEGISVEFVLLSAHLQMRILPMALILTLKQHK